MVVRKRRAYRAGMSEPDDPTFNNCDALARVRRAGCHMCLSTFDVGRIDAWRHRGRTALCPHCNSDAVVPGVDDPAGLRAAHERWRQNAETRPAVFSPDPE